MKNEIDLHGFTVIEAKKHLKVYLNNLRPGTHELDVIHGFNSGNELQKYIRNTFNHKRLDKKIIGMNNGITTFIIN